MNSHRFRVIEVLQTHEGLYKEGLCVLEIEMENGHHGNAKVRSA